MNIAAMSDQEVVTLVLGQSLEAQVRRMLHESAGRIEQSYAQGKGPSGVQVRRMELEDAARIVDLVARAERSRIREGLLAARPLLAHLRSALDNICPEEAP